MAQMTWNEFSAAALTTNGLLSDLLLTPGDPNSVLKAYGLGELSPSDITQWQSVLASTSTAPSQKDILQYIARLLPSPGSDMPIAHDAPPTW